MTLSLPIQFIRVAFFLIHTFSAAAELSAGFCDRAIYGQPNYSDCVALLYGTSGQRSAGIIHIDIYEHGFLLPYFGGSGQFTIDQWRHRVNLPEIWHNGTPKCPTQSFVGKLYPAEVSYVDKCKIALLVKTGPTGEFTTDSGSWAQIASRGKALVDYCLMTKRATQRDKWGGGVGLAGSHSRLNIVVYGWGSSFDLAITSGIGPSGPVGIDWNKSMTNLSASGRVGNLSQA